ncbi:4-hydroxy-tetrahydrodipicolinate synthase [Sporosalibacterium faouarense]|uniref:4-hydroxy-tetrahydrodipicolinate synthase n=1 Tax=Sporosalibacterium faouarense TaxID=516123 RepID=UPI00141C7FE4|nr:4-hydroxy-tetrahydrodipicolinate synthase [Sporosalibacterium faouarense]MTI49539.1 4-hydroxy-tetrahydrodipicolinate synthase [Bacillota bacterium]
MTLFRGSGVAIVTPFTENGIDFKKLDELINWQINEGTDGIIICGTTGEASTMTEKEHKATIKCAVNSTKKRVPVIAGTGSNNTQHAIEMSQYAESVGVDGLLIVTPYYNKTTQKGLINHYTAIADSVDLPIIVYNVPSRTGLNVLPSTLVKLSEHKNIVAVKEASGDIGQVAEMARLLPDDFDIYSGNDNMIVPLMSLGGKGVISVVANILPKDTHNMASYYLEGKIEEAKKLQLKMNGLVNALFVETNPIPVKTAMNLLGMNVGKLRLPLTEMSTSNLEILKEEMNLYGLQVGM